MKTIIMPDRTSDLIKAGSKLIVIGHALIEWIGESASNLGNVLVSKSDYFGPFSQDVSFYISAISGEVKFGIDMGVDAYLIDLIDKEKQLNAYVDAKIKIMSSSALRAVEVGNSITSDAAWTNGRNPSSWKGRNELAWAMQRAPGLIELRKFTDALATGKTTYSGTGNTDMYGVFGYGGARIDEINATIVSASPNQQLIPLLQAAGTIPDLVLGLALFENDIGQGRTFTQIKADTIRHIQIWRSFYRNIRIGIATCRPTYSADTPAKRQTWIDLNNWLMEEFDGTDRVWAIPVHVGYSDPNSPANPKYESLIGTISGNTLTVTRAPETSLEIGMVLDAAMYVSNTAVTITALGTGVGGVGTYTISNIASVSTSGELFLLPYTDEVVHPNNIAASINGDIIADWMRRTIMITGIPTALGGPNPSLSGSAAINYVAGGPQSGSAGTAPTGVTHASASNAAVNFTLAALNPGLELSGTVSDTTTVVGPGDISFYDVNPMPAGIKRLRQYADIELVEGAEYIKSLTLVARVWNGATQLNPSSSSIGPASAEPAPIMRNGKVIRLETGDVISPTNLLTDDITRMNSYLKIGFRIGVGNRNFKFRVLSAGYVDLTSVGV